LNDSRRIWLVEYFHVNLRFMKHLYSDFLRDKKVHSLNEAFYKRLLKAVTGSQPVPYFRKVYGNGRKIYDDHIFNTIHNDRILQIIQREPASEQPVLKGFNRDNF